ncbi:MAG: DNA polymerase III subunit delta [Clostridia bacterium]|nr:DNA polymerase III subunit delta [Clostridia bacterium]MBQ6803205.1 DNA polymerase III subunit delta [Clostridia bacterium]
MKHSEFFAALKKGEIGRCYLFEGEEEFTKRSALQAIRKMVAGGDFAEMNDTRLSNPPPDELIAAAETLPFLSDRRFIEVRDCALLMSGKSKEYDEDTAVRRLDEYMGQLPDSVCIVFYMRGKADGRKKFYQILKKKALIVSFDPLDDRELAQWIAKTLGKAGKKISMAACQRLWFSAGRDLTLLDNEIGKLIAYAGEKEEITEADIQAICIQSTEYKVYDMADTLLSGQGKKAMGMLNALLRDGEERLMLLSLLGRQCRQLRYAKAMASQGAQQGEIAGKIGVPPFAVKKTLDLARQYTMKQLADMARLCLETEYQVKSGQLMDVGSLERVMLEILSMREGHHG